MRDDDLGLIGSRELRGPSSRERWAERAVHDHVLERVRPGVFVSRSQWVAAGDDARARARIRAVAATRRRAHLVFSHESAALVHRLPIARPWPTTVHITEPVDSMRRSKHGVTVHRAAIDDRDVVEVDGLLATSLVRTLVDLARTAPTIDAIVAIDAARDRRRPRVTLEDLDAGLGRVAGRGAARAARIVEASVDEAQSPPESVARYTVTVMGFPAPVPQMPVVLLDGRRRFLDLGWPELGAGLEMDGRSKYQDDPASVLWSEKRREADLADVGIRLARGAVADLHDLRRLDVRLRAIGIPRLPRPYPRSAFELP